MKLLSMLCVACMTAAHAQEAVTFYVSPSGNDAWSGKLPAPNAGKTDGPFASIERARDAVRSSRRAGSLAPCTVEIREGVYMLAETLTFSPEDSGTPEAPVTYRAYRREQPVISGGRVIADFRAGTINDVPCWVADVPDVRAGWAFRQLFVKRNDQQHFERRYRSTKGMHIIAGLTYSPARKTMAHRAAQKDFRFFSGDFERWENLADVEVVALHSWSASRLLVEDLDMDHNVVTFTSMPTFRIGHWYPAGRNPYFIENVREYVTQPGQWYLDRNAEKLYYIPEPGETPESVTIVAPKLEILVSVAGNAENTRFVENLHFRGITFAHAAWNLPREGYDVSQGQPTLPAAVQLSWARSCSVDRCTVAHVGAYGLSLGMGCHGNRVAGCRLIDLGGGGVKVGNSRMPRAAKAPILPTENTVENNLIAGGGRIHASANAVWAGIVKKTAIRHNEIRDFPYTGIAVGWSWGYSETSAEQNTIAYNHIHDVMKLVQDGGGIYTLGQQPGTVIRGNRIHDVLRGPFACNIGQLGIYLDEGSGPFLIEDNIVYNVQMGAFNQHYGRDNTVRNNIFAFVAQEPITCARAEDHHSFTFTHNIVYLTTGNMISTRHNPVRCNTAFNHNLYFDTTTATPMFGADTFAEWQATGRDRDSLIADPRFVDAASFDFRLQPDSPALTLGIKPIDPQLAGLEPAYRDIDPHDIPLPQPPVYAMSMPVLPPPQPGFSIDCEDIPPGVCPREFACSGCAGERGGFEVTDEAAYSGTRSIKGFEKTGLPKPFYPYLLHHISGKPITDGHVTFTFAVMNSPDAPADITVEMRDTINNGDREYLTGPLLRIAPDGTLSAGDDPIGTIQNGVWAKATISFALGDDADGTYTVTVKPSGSQPEFTVTHPFGHKEFTSPTWLGIISGGTQDAAFYLDDLVFTVE